MSELAEIRQRLADLKKIMLGENPPSYGSVVQTLDAYVERIDKYLALAPVYWLIDDHKVEGWEVVGPMSKDELIKYVQDEAVNLARIYIFKGGERIHTSTPPFQHILFDDGPAIPIFRAFANLEQDPSGLIEAPNRPSKPAGPERQLKRPAQGDDGFGN